MKFSEIINLKIFCPELVGQWHPDKNGNLTPDQVTPGTIKKVWWICEKGHEWQAQIANRNHGNGCPFCSGREAGKDSCLKAVNPKLTMQWHPVKNGKLTPDQVMPGSGKRVWWKCKKGHEWKSSIIKRNNGDGCPYCSGKKPSKENNLEVKNPTLAREFHPWKNKGLVPAQVTPGSDRKVWWKCNKTSI